MKPGNDGGEHTVSTAPPPARQPGRPRSREADEAILAAALDLLIERGIGSASIEQIARRAGVTRATVYRRFPTLTDLLVRAIEWEYRDVSPGPQNQQGGPDATGWPDMEAMVKDWAGHLSQPRARRLIRRLYGSVDDLPELLQAYDSAYGHHRGRAVRATLERARAAGRLPPDSDLEILQLLLSGAALQHLAAPDTTSQDDVEAYFLAVLRQAGYRRPPSHEGAQHDE